jgi:hypothetical protein
MRRARVALLLSVALLVIVGALTLAHAPPRLLGRGARPEESLGLTTTSATVCQTGETLPGGTSAIRIGLEASFGPKVFVHAYSGSQLLTSGSRGANWTGSSVTVPVKSLQHDSSGVKLCLDVPANSGRLQLWGAQAPAGKAAVGGSGEALPGRISVEYLGSGRGSWWSRAQSVARHIGLGHPIAGTWVALLLAMLTGLVCALVIGLAWRELP